MQKAKLLLALLLVLLVVLPLQRLLHWELLPLAVPRQQPRKHPSQVQGRRIGLKDRNRLSSGIHTIIHHFLKAIRRHHTMDITWNIHLHLIGIIRNTTWSIRHDLPCITRRLTSTIHHPIQAIHHISQTIHRRMVWSMILITRNLSLACLTHQDHKALKVEL